MSSAPRLRKRIIPRQRNGSVKIGTLYRRNAVTGNWDRINDQFSPFNAPYVSAKLTLDYLHQKTRGKYMDGDPFKTMDVQYHGPDSPVGNGSYISATPDFSGQLQKYVGGFHHPGTGIYGNDSEVNNLNLVLTPYSSLFPNAGTYATQAWNISKPRLERADVLVAALEGRDTPRMLKTTASIFSKGYKSLLKDTFTSGGVLNERSFRRVSGLKKMPRTVSEHFLNHFFGWAPFVNDLSKMINTYDNSLRLIRQFMDQNGKYTHVRRSVVDSQTIQKINSGSGNACSPSLGSNFWVSNPVWEVEEAVHTVVTSSGQFRFYRPEFAKEFLEDDSIMHQMRVGLILYGAEISPSHLYHATPWTWLVDWFTPLGNYVDQLNDTVIDGVAARYFYVMHHKERVLTFRQYLPMQGSSLTLEFVRKIDTKERLPVTSPYGFDSPWSNLSAKRLAILAALGITRR